MIFIAQIASKLAHTYSDRHGLKDLCRELLRIDISKQQQSSDWGADSLSDEQANYAAGDVLYLHQIRAHLGTMLEREGRQQLAAACFAFIRTRTALDLGGFADLILRHHRPIPLPRRPLWPQHHQHQNAVNSPRAKIRSW